MSFIEDLRQDLRVAARALWRQPGFTLVAVLSLAAGIGLNSVVFGVIDTIFFRTVRGVPTAERLAFVAERASFPAYQHLRAGTRTLDGLAAWDMTLLDVRYGAVAERRAAPAVSDDYFAVLGVRPALGTLFTASSRPSASSSDRPAAAPIAVLDHAFWRELGSPRDIVGRAVVVNGIPLTVVGVAPEEFHGIGPARPPLWVPLGMLPALEGRRAAWSDTTPRRWRLIGRLHAGATLPQARAELRVLAARAPALFGPGPLGVDDGRESITADSPEKRAEFLLVTVVPLVVVAVLLWIGCSNVANLLLARAVFRRREIVVRLANGASRGRLVRMLLAESVLLAALGGVAGAVAGSWALRMFAVTFPEFSALDVRVDGRVIAYTGVVALLSTLVFGLVPALHATRVDVARSLGAGGAPGGRETASGGRLRTFFLVTQLATSVVLLVVAASFVRTLVGTYVGEQAATIDHVVVAHVASADTSPARRVAFWRKAREAADAVPGVVAVSVLPAGDAESPARLARAGTVPLDVTLERVDSAFFRVMGHVLVAGRAPDASAGAPAEVTINEAAAARLWPGGRPTFGASLVTSGASGASPADSQVVALAGVVRDGAPAPRAYRRLDDAGLGALGEANLLVRTAGPAAAFVPSVRAALAPLAPDPAFTRAESLRDAAVGPLRRLTRAVAVLSAVALVLAAVGLYGSIAFFTSQRTREIAVRVAVGAARAQVLRLLAGYGARVVGAGVGVGLALSVVAFRLLRGMLFGRWPFDVAACAAIVLVLALTTLAACWVPGRRATRVDPMEALRSE